MKQEEIQEKLILYQFLQRHLDELKNQAVIVERKFIEFESTSQAFNDIRSISAGKETIIPLGSGFYIHGKVLDKDSMLTEIGAGVVMNKSLEESAEMLEGKKKELEKITHQLQEEINNVVAQINMLTPALEQALQDLQGKK